MIDVKFTCGLLQHQLNMFQPNQLSLFAQFFWLLFLIVVPLVEWEFEEKRLWTSCYVATSKKCDDLNHVASVMCSETFSAGNGSWTERRSWLHRTQSDSHSVYTRC